MSREEQVGIGNCPHCTKIIFKDAVFNSEASFSTRCPHCNKAVKVIIKRKVEITLIAVQDERVKKMGIGSGLIILILMPYWSMIIHHTVRGIDSILILT